VSSPNAYDLSELPAPEGPDQGDRRSRLLGTRSPMRQEGAKGVAIAVLSTVVVLGVIVWVVLHSKNWPAVQQLFFNGQEFKDTFPEIARAFVHNIEWCLIAEVFILAFALILAIVKNLPGPVFFPLRLLVIIYTDVFRGIPLILLVYLLGFGIPSLQIPGLPTAAAFWGIVALILCYSAYVAEVYRAGLDSVHPSQSAAARALGLSRVKTLRFVVVPQAVRNVLPPLLNDFIGLQKDTAIVGFVSLTVDAMKQASIDQSADFNFTPLLSATILFLLITIPLTRLVDVLISRQRARRQGGTAL
jgi:polar amino acid transport system permease protein